MMRVLLALALVLVVAGPARAEEPKDVAAQFFRAGRAAYERKEYRAAALAFTEAYKRLPRGGAIYNAARSWEAALEPDLAADAFARALGQSDLDADDAAYANEHLAALEAQLAIVDVTQPPAAIVIVRGVERGPVPAVVHIAPGKHEVHVRRRDGSDVARTIEVTRPGEHVTLAFEDVWQPKPAPPAPAPAPAPEAPPRPWPAYASLGLSAALTGVGVYTYVRFADARSTFEQNGSHDASERDTAQKWRSFTYAFWGGALAFAALGAVLLFTADTRPTRARAALRVDASGLGASW
jgi:hypothetical protein